MKMNDEIEILYVSFNQDSSCFAVGTDYGFHIFSSVPFKLNLERSHYFYLLQFSIMVLA